MIKIGDRKVGYGYKPVLSAELSINHLGDLETALQMVDSAAANGAGAIKTQHYITEDFCRDKTETLELNGEQVNVYDLFKKSELTLDEQIQIASRTKEHGLIFHATPTSIDRLNEINDYVDCWKISSEMFHCHELRQAAKDTGKPVIVSTGHVKNLAALKDDRPFADLYLHCVSEYPAEDAKLWKMLHLQKFGFDTGYSDHTGRYIEVEDALNMGALWIECHFMHQDYFDDDNKSPDKALSFSSNGIKAISDYL